MNKVTYNEEDHLDISEDKFKNVFVERGIMTKEICEWIMNESNEQVKKLYGTWKNDRHINYPTHDIALEKMPDPVKNLILLIFKNKIGNLLFNNYNISNEFTCNIIDCFIVKYDMYTQQKLVMHHDDTDMSVSILLSDEKIFQGGGLRFENCLSVFPKQGDAILHCSKHRHEGLEITSGVRMILVFFIDVIKQNIKM